MDFTREPVIETIITPKEGFKLCVRNSKGAPQEEYFVDALEVVSFGNAFFFRSRERPRPFLAPVSDYEVIEVREARMVLKHVGSDRSIKIGGGKDKRGRERGKDKDKEKDKQKDDKDSQAKDAATESGKGSDEESVTREGRGEKKRRRQSRRRRGQREESSEERSEAADEEKPAEPSGSNEPDAEAREPEHTEATLEEGDQESKAVHQMIAPPETLISDNIERYRDFMAEPEEAQAPTSHEEAAENAGFPGRGDAEVESASQAPASEDSPEESGASVESLKDEQEEVSNDEVKQ